MAKRYRLGRANRLINLLFRALTRLGLGASYRHILTVAGRKTGRLYSAPVDVLEHDGNRFLVAGYGPAGWVRNARAAGEVTLSRGRQTARFRVAEAGPEEAIPALRKYIAEIKVTRADFDNQTRPTRRSRPSSRGTPSSASSRRDRRGAGYCVAIAAIPRERSRHGAGSGRGQPQGHGRP